MLHRLSITAALLLAATAPAFAHLDPGAPGSILAGLTHPLSGLDHILAMVAVGLWAAMVGGRAVWIVPTSFVVVMAAGFALALSGTPLPFVEPAILASVVALGLLVALSVRLPVSLCAAVVGGFALFHGYAHGGGFAEGGGLGGAGALRFAFGFAVSTAILHAAGLGLGLVLARKGGLWGARLAGGATAVAGLALMVA